MYVNSKKGGSVCKYEEGNRKQLQELKEIKEYYEKAVDKAASDKKS